MGPPFRYDNTKQAHGWSLLWPWPLLDLRDAHMYNQRVYITCSCPAPMVMHGRADFL